MRKQKKEYGITLVALVITIIVLIILAGISIGMIAKNGGLLLNTETAKDETIKSQALEELRLLVTNVEIEKKGNATLTDIVDALDKDSENEYTISLEQTSSINGKIPDLSNTEKIYVTYKKLEFEIDKNLNVYFVSNVDRTNESIQEIGEKTEFDYAGNYQEYEVKDNGYYKIECVGAKGGTSRKNGKVGTDGGNGGYTSGIIYLEKGEKIYVYVGGHGADAVVGKDSIAGYNGGGLGTWDHSDDESAGARRRSNRY